MFHLSKKIPVGILGATGVVGQKFVELLSNHPLFEIKALGASEKSTGKFYGEAMTWRMAAPLETKIAQFKLHPCTPEHFPKVVFSGLDSSVAGDIETNFAKASFTVISNSKNHRMDEDVPLIIPEVNSDHLNLLNHQSHKGRIVTNPNCSVIGLTTALKPLAQEFGIDKVHVVTLQAVSGAGYPGVSSFDILDNVIPFISGEEEKIEQEPLKILGELKGAAIKPYPMQISAQCNRVAVMDGHMACVSLSLQKKTSEAKDIIDAWKRFGVSFQNNLSLPSLPKETLIYLEDRAHPQPKLHRHLNNGMTVSLGRLQKCPLLDWKFVLLSHNTIRGAAGSAILNAELMLLKGFIKE
ncbi:aspartate-semialdehyde dehydrogenase [Criblamydia sequanensis]|uniref:Aspartate-semialdehyde dehydrogenase n=1 Tax=Candidatus Criblamydia sequanensis CRIB-18 TaxID=1437425 RepID=A0A090CXZ9_9BACT|nr:aspartate-semialdehyde dehydrogenase [Criblamydia sequanensis]CDR33162.1 Aspartate-semialdehyde dehydrogenase [Criblamydia sequanensis CRIB-18]